MSTYSSKLTNNVSETHCYGFAKQLGGLKEVFVCLCVCTVVDLCVCVLECCSNNSQWEQISVWSLWWQHQERKRWWLSSPALDSNWPSISSFVSNTHTQTSYPISIATCNWHHPVPLRSKIQVTTCVNVCLLRTDTQHTHGKHHHLNNRWRLEMTGGWRSERGSVEN